MCREESLERSEEEPYQDEVAEGLDDNAEIKGQ